MRPGRRSLLLAAPLGFIGLAATGCTLFDDAPDPDATTSAPPQGSSDGKAFEAAAVEASTAALPPLQAVKDLKPLRLGDGLVPPTNRWFSGLVFGDASQPVFPLPLSFAVQDGAYALGLPTVTTTEKVIMGVFAPEVTVKVPGLVTGVVTRYDEASVTIRADDSAGKGIGELTIAEGWPCVSFRALDDVELTLSAALEGGSTPVLRVGKNTYGAVTDSGKISGATCTLPADGTLTLYVVPPDGHAEDLAPLATPLASTSLAYAVDDTVATSTLTYATHSGDTTAIAAMPHHGADPKGDDVLGTYPSSYGTLVLRRGTELSWTAPLRAARAELDLSALDDASREELATQVTSDVGSLRDYPADTYFGGKALHRDAQLLGIARQVGADEAATSLTERVLTQIRMWTEVDGATKRDGFCFTYDETNKGVIGLTPSFGSDEYNDHHFHYGYFLYAAGTLAAQDPSLVEELAPVIDALAADVANDAVTPSLPVRRTFDAYASHSWASGTSPFADGNNQESSSEAVTAWAGLQLWAQASGNEQLATQAAWMLAHEAHTARVYWTDFDTSDPVYEGFGHTVIPLQFGGKRDYATWFSPEPAAALAILVLPLSPSSDHLADDPARVRDNIAEATATAGFTQTYGDWLIMYSALGGDEAKTAALTAARELDAGLLDDGNTRSYLLAFIMTR